MDWQEIETKIYTVLTNQSELRVEIEDSIYTIIIFGFLFFAVIAVFYNPVKRYLIRRKELKETGTNLVQNEPHPKRPLTEVERGILEHSAKSDRKFTWIYLFFFIAAFVIFTQTGGYEELIRRTPWVLGLTAAAAALFTFLIFHQSRNKGSHGMKDLESQVFELTGTVYKEASRYKSYVTVRGVTFDGSQMLQSGYKLYDDVDDGNEVKIEYSPNSKYIWKLTHVKAENIA